MGKIEGRSTEQDVPRCASIIFHTSHYIPSSIPSSHCMPWPVEEVTSCCLSLEVNFAFLLLKSGFHRGRGHYHHGHGNKPCFVCHAGVSVLGLDTSRNRNEGGRVCCEPCPGGSKGRHLSKPSRCLREGPISSCTAKMAFAFAHHMWDSSQLAEETGVRSTYIFVSP